MTLDLNKKKITNYDISNNTKKDCTVCDSRVSVSSKTFCRGNPCGCPLVWK